MIDRVIAYFVEVFGMAMSMIEWIGDKIIVVVVLTAGSLVPSPPLLLPPTTYAIAIASPTT
jgi:hypothetical protein